MAFPVVLYQGRAKSGEAVLVDGGLPIEEFVDGKGIALAGFLKTEQPTANGGDHFCLAADNPTAGIPWREVRNRQRTSIRTDHVLYAGTHLDGHCTHLLNLTTHENLAHRA